MRNLEVEDWYMSNDSYSLDNYIDDLRRITRATDDEGEIIASLGPLARRLALNKAWLKPHHYEADPESGFTAHTLHEEPDHTLAVFVVSWLPGRGTPPHDHGTWAVVAGVEGVERNIWYKRIDDRGRSDYAELDIKMEKSADAGDLVCMKTGGIHMVQNETDKVTLSLHTYGKHINFTERSQFNLETNEKKDFKIDVR